MRENKESSSEAWLMMEKGKKREANVGEIARVEIKMIWEKTRIGRRKSNNIIIRKFGQEMR